MQSILLQAESPRPEMHSTEHKWIFQRVSRRSITDWGRGLRGGLGDWGVGQALSLLSGFFLFFLNPPNFYSDAIKKNGRNVLLPFKPFSHTNLQKRNRRIRSSLWGDHVLTSVSTLALKGSVRAPTVTPNFQSAYIFWLHATLNRF